MNASKPTRTETNYRAALARAKHIFQALHQHLGLWAEVLLAAA